MRRVRLLALLCPLSCFAPEPAVSSEDDETSADSATATTAEPTSAADASTGTGGDASTTSSDPSTDSTGGTADPSGDPSGPSDTSTDDGTTGAPTVCGDGVFAPGELCWDDVVLFDGGDVTYASRLVDLDGDGDDDLTWMIGDQIGVRLSTGDGAFGNDLSGPTVGPSDGEVGDVDGDGAPDFAIINDFDNTLQIVRGDGSGNYLDPAAAVVASMTPQVVLVADLDGELGDEVIIGAAQSVDVFKSDGDDTPQPGWGFGGAGSVLALAVANLDGDGDPDLVYVREYAGDRNVVARLGNGDGSFGGQSFIDSIGAMPTAVGGGDFDGDGDGDIAYVDGTDAMLYVQLGNGALGFADAVGVATDVAPRRMRVLDTNGDGNDDVVVGHGASNSLWILAGDGAGGFAEPVTIPLAGPVDSLGVGEANGDGVPDFVTTDTGQENITVIMSSP